MKKIKILVICFCFAFCFKFSLATEKVEILKNNQVNLEKNKISNLDKEKIENFLKENLKYYNEKTDKIKENLVYKIENFFEKNENYEKFIYEYQYCFLDEKNKIKLGALDFVFNKKDSELKLTELKNLKLKPNILKIHMPINVTEDFLNKLKTIWELIEKKQTYFIKQSFKNIAENFKKNINKEIKKNPLKEEYLYQEELILKPQKKQLKPKKIKIIFKLFEDENFKENLKLDIKLEI